MNTLRYAFTGVLLTALIGCVSVNIQSNVSPDARPDFRRVLIVSKLSVLSPDYLSKFKDAFPPDCQVCSVANKPISFVSLDQSIQQGIRDCNSEVLLTLGFGRNYTSGGGEYISSYNEVYAEMSSVASGKPFWKAVITTNGSNEVPPQKIVNQLLKDGIITGRKPKIY